MKTTAKQNVITDQKTELRLGMNQEIGRSPDQKTTISDQERIGPWQAEREKARHEHGEEYFKNRSHEDLIEDFLTVNASEAIRTRQLIKAREENSSLLRRIESMKKEITQLKQLNEAYGISLDRFFKSRSVSCLKRI